MTDAPSSLSSRVATAAGWMVAARFVIRLVSLIGVFVMARLLTPADFGVAAAATSMLALAQGFTDLHFANALVRKREIPDTDWDTVWTLGMARGVILGVLLAFGGPILARLLGAPEAGAAMAAISIVAIISGLENPRLILFARALSMRQEFIFYIVVQLVTTISIVGFALIRPDYWALVFGAIIGAITRVMLSYALIGYRPRFGVKGAWSLFGFSGWLSGAQALQTINSESDKFFILGRLDASALGLYRMGQTIVSLPTSELVQPLTRGFFPAFSMLQNDPGRMRAAYMKAQQVVLTVGLPIGIGLPFVADDLVALALGPGWEDAALIVKYLAPVMALQMVSAGVEAAAMATGDTKKIFWRALLIAVLRTPLLLAGVILAGLEGLLLARVVAGVMFIVVNLNIVRKTLNIPMIDMFLNAARTWIAVLAMGGALAILLLWAHALDALVRLGATVLLGASVYLGTLLALWLAAGRPAGAERVLVGVGLKVVARLRQR